MSEKRRRTSDIWNYFEIVGTSTASCNMCKSVLSFKSTNSNLRKHIERKHVLVLDHLVPTEKSGSRLSEEHADTAETNSLPEPSSPSEPVYNTIYAESLADKDFSASSGSEYSPDGQNNVIGEEIVKTDLPSEERPAKKLAFKRPYKEKPVIEDDRYILHSIINPKNGSKNVAKTLQDLSEAQMTSNSLKEQQLIVEKNRNEIFSHFLTIFKNMTEKNYLNNSSRAAAGAASACASSSPSGSLSTSMYHNSRKLEVDEDRPTTFKHSRTKECYNNDHPEGDVNWLTDLEIEEKKIEIDERRLKLEERKLIMEGQMKERKIALDEKKLKLEGQKANSEDQPEERKLEIDEAQMKFNDQKFMLEVQIEERKLEIDEKRLKLEKRKMYLMEQKKLCNGK